MKKRIIAVLELRRLVGAKKTEKARNMVKSMTNNSWFEDPEPELETVEANAKFYEDACIDAKNGGPKDKAKRQELGEILDGNLIELRDYVQKIANKNPESAESIILGASLSVKKESLHTAAGFKVKQTLNEGEVKVRATFEHGTIYHWQMSTDNTNWADIGVSTKASVVKAGLTKGAAYYFRVAIDKKGMHPYSDSISIVIA